MAVQRCAALRLEEASTPFLAAFRDMANAFASTDKIRRDEVVKEMTLPPQDISRGHLIFSPRGWPTPLFFLLGVPKVMRSASPPRRATSSALQKDLSSSPRATTGRSRNTGMLLLALHHESIFSRQPALRMWLLASAPMQTIRALLEWSLVAGQLLQHLCWSWTMRSSMLA